VSVKWKYRVLSIRSPWVGAVACGIKKYEFRPWDQCRYRGPLLIHHSAGGTKRQQREAYEWIVERFGEEVAKRCTRDDSITAGRIIAVVHVVDFVPLVQRVRGFDVPHVIPIDVSPEIQRWKPPAYNARGVLVLAGAVRLSHMSIAHTDRLNIHYRELPAGSADQLMIEEAIAESAAAVRAGLEVTP